MARRRRRSDIRDTAGEAAAFRQRALIGFGVVVLALGVLAGWYFKLQVVDHDIYAKRSEANRIKPRPVVPGRGLILDRKGRILAENEQAYRLDVTPEEAGDMRQLLAGLSRIIALSPDDIARFDRERKGQRSFRAVTLKLRLSEDEMARFALDRWRFPGVEVVPYLNRHYPYGDLFAHVVGYVGRTDQADVDRYGASHLLFPQTGRTGLERYYDELLRGKIGYEQVETNVEGRALRRHLPDDARIYVLSGHMEGADLRGLIPVLNSPEQFFRDRALRPRAPFAIQLDTGMNRLGIEPGEWAAIRAEAVAAVAALQAALDRGVTPDEARQTLEGVGIEAPEALTREVPSLDSLQASFPEAARAALRASLRQDSAAGNGSLFGNFIRAQTGARSVEPREGTDPDAILSRADAAVEEGRIGEAVTEIEALPEPGKTATAMAEWLAGATAYRDAQAALSDLSAPAN